MPYFSRDDELGEGEGGRIGHLLWLQGMFTLDISVIH